MAASSRGTWHRGRLHNKSVRHRKMVSAEQSCSRGDIEDIRGVIVSSNIIKALQARGWIDVVGNREVPGRPELFATTRQFLDDLALRSLTELPALDDLGQLVDTVSEEVAVGAEAGAADATEEAVHDAESSEMMEEGASPTLN